MYLHPIRLEITSERAIELYNLNMRKRRKLFQDNDGYSWKVESEQKLNDILGNGRTSLWIDPEFINKEEYDYFMENNANFFKKGNYSGYYKEPNKIYWNHNICILGVQKETYPGRYYIGEC